MAAGRPVLILACVYPPENVVGAERPARFARYLPQFAYDPYVVTSSEQPESGAPPHVLRAPYRFGYFELLLMKTAFPHDDRLTWMPSAVRAAERLLSTHSEPILFSTSPPISAHWAAHRLKQRHGLPWVADFRDPLVGNFGRVNKFVRISDCFIERRIARHADRIILNTEAAATAFRARYPGLSDKVHFIYNGYDPHDGLAPRPVPPRAAKVWIHSGSVYLNRYPERLFVALARLVASDRFPRPPCVRMIGLVQDPALFQFPAFRQLKEQGCIDCTPEHVPKLQAWKETAEADGTIVFDHYHSETVNLAIPAKIFDYIRVGRPILAFTSRGSQLHDLITRSGIRNVCMFEDDPPAEVELKLLAFAELPNEALPASEWFRRQFSAVEQTRQLALLFDELHR